MLVAVFAATGQIVRGVVDQQEMHWRGQFDAEKAKPRFAKAHGRAAAPPPVI
jgi:hypothetical protein